MRVRPHALRLRRIARGLTQNELAEQVGLTQSWYSQLETGKTPGGLRAIKKLAEFFNCSILDLVELDQEDEVSA